VAGLGLQTQMKRAIFWVLIYEPEHFAYCPSLYLPIEVAEERLTGFWASGLKPLRDWNHLERNLAQQRLIRE
jgi:hypothetical protein